MGLGYTLMMYDSDSVKQGLSDIGACRYDGAELGLEKLRSVGVTQLNRWLQDYELDAYCVMAEWPVSTEAVERISDGAELVSEIGASYYGILPPERHREETATVKRWMRNICEAAEEAGITPLIHHHGATAIEQPDEIEWWLENGPPNLELLFDTAHYYPYGDLIDGLSRFGDDIGYVHLKDVDPPAEFAGHTAALSSESYHLDDVINYFRAFTDLGEGVIDFDAVSRALEDIGYTGHVTIEIENQTELLLVHAKQNFDYWQSIVE